MTPGQTTSALSPAAQQGAGVLGGTPAPSTPPRLTTPPRRPKELLLKWCFAACALISILTTFGIIAVLISESVPFFREVSLWQFLTGREWAPLFEPAHFGVLPLICGTFLVAAGAALFTLPLGLLSAIYLSEFASSRARLILKPVLELLAGVPTVVYGYFALQVITPLIQRIFPIAEGFNALSAAIAIAIMTLPMVSSLCEDALHAVPRSLREGAYALGSTKMEVSLKVVVPAALSGLAAAFILAISRALGETMIVAIAAGATPKLTANPLVSVQTMTGYIVQVSLGDVPHGSIGYQTIFAVGMVLFALTVGMNLISMALVNRYRQKYD